MSTPVVDSSPETAALSFRSVLKRLSGDTLVFGVGTVIARAISFLLLPIYTRAMLPAEYAKVDVVLALNSVLVIITILGIDSGIVIAFMGQDKKTQGRIAASSLVMLVGWSLMLTLMLGLFAGPISKVMLSNANLAPLVALSFYLLPAQAMVAFALNLHKWKREPIRFVLLTVGVSLLTAAANIYFINKMNLGAQGVILGTILANLVFVVISLLSITHHIEARLSLIDARAVLVYGLPFCIGSIFNMLVPNINRVFLVNMVGLNSTGLFSAGMRLCQVVFHLNVAFDLAYFPYALSITQSRSASGIYTRVARLYGLLLMMASAGMFLFARPIVEIFLGNKSYTDAYTIMGPLLLGFWINGLQAPLSLGIYISRKTKFVTWGYVLGTLASIPLNAILIYFWGIQGAAWASLGVQLTIAAALYTFGQKQVPMPFELRPLFVLAGAYMLIMFGMNWYPSLPVLLDLAVRLIIALAFIGLTVRFSGALKQEERQAAWSILRSRFVKKPVR